MNRDKLHIGLFGINEDQIDIPGVLVLDGENTTLDLFNMTPEQFQYVDKSFKTEKIGGTIFGLQVNGKQVTLLGCIPMHIHYGDYTIQIYPHFVIFGCYLHSNSPRINRVLFTIDDKLMSEGQDSFEQVTKHGIIRINSDNPHCIEIEFSPSISFNKLHKKIMIFIRFFDFILRDPQNRYNIQITCDNLYEPYKLFESNPLKCEIFNRKHKSPLISVSNQHFGTILKNWIERNDSWLVSRRNCSISLREGRYTSDRLIRSANLFDNIPKNEFVYPDHSNYEGVVEVRRAIKNINPKNSPLRRDLLDVLESKTRLALKEKIEQRINKFPDEIKSLIPNIDKAYKRAVDYRNILVHGENHNSAGLQRENIPFLTQTLEFIFVTTDLVDSGWDMVDWNKDLTTSGHPYNYFLRNFETNYKKLFQESN